MSWWYDSNIPEPSFLFVTELTHNSGKETILHWPIFSTAFCLLALAFTPGFSLCSPGCPQRHNNSPASALSFLKFFKYLNNRYNTNYLIDYCFKQIKFLFSSLSRIIKVLKTQSQVFWKLQYLKVSSVSRMRARPLAAMAGSLNLISRILVV